MVYIVLLISLFFGPINETHKLVKTKISSDITVSIPSELMAMTPDDIALRHPSVRKPIAAYSDADRMIDFSIKTSATQWPDANVEMSMKFFKAGVYNLYDRVEMINEGIQEIHKKNYIFFEFDSRINGDQRSLGDQDSILKYTYVMYLVEKNRTLVITFSCPDHLKEDWQETARAVMMSLHIK
jgi:hypothetical protein